MYFLTGLQHGGRNVLRNSINSSSRTIQATKLEKSGNGSIDFFLRFYWNETRICPSEIHKTQTCIAACGWQAKCKFSLPKWTEFTEKAQFYSLSPIHLDQMGISTAVQSCLIVNQIQFVL